MSKYADKYFIERIKKLEDKKKMYKALYESGEKQLSSARTYYKALESQNASLKEDIEYILSLFMCNWYSGKSYTTKLIGTYSDEFERLDDLMNTYGLVTDKMWEKLEEEWKREKSAKQEG